METNIKQAVCESRNSEKVIKFLTEKELTDEIVKAIENAVIWGVYYNDDGEIVAEIAGVGGAGAQIKEEVTGGAAKITDDAAVAQRTGLESGLSHVLIDFVTKGRCHRRVWAESGGLLPGQLPARGLG